jgi:hypothetical protein
MKLSDHVEAVHVDAEECRDEVAEMSHRNVALPIEQTGRAIPKRPRSHDTREFSRELRLLEDA